MAKLFRFVTNLNSAVCIATVQFHYNSEAVASASQNNKTVM